MQGTILDQIAPKLDQIGTQAVSERMRGTAYLNLTPNLPFKCGPKNPSAMS